MKTTHPFTRCLLLAGLLVTCLEAPALAAAPADAALTAAITDLTPLPSPALQRAESSTLAVGPDGRVWLTWFEPNPAGGNRLQVASLSGSKWSRPFTAAAGRPFFVNWAEVPGVMPFGGNRLAVYWPEKIARPDIAYGLNLAFADGEKVGPSVTPYRDRAFAPHGFPSLLPEGAGLRLIWLDGRFSAPKPDSAGDTQLRASYVDGSGVVSGEQVLDGRVCDCCRTAMVAVPDGMLAAYRDRSPGEVRDIMLVRFEKGVWGKPYPLHQDGWTINGCPVNGPALAARGPRVLATWYTSYHGVPTLFAAFSQDGGRTFAPPLVVDDKGTLGRPQALLLEDGSAIVAWVKGRRDGERIVVARLMPDGRVGPPTEIGSPSGRHASGYPQMVRTGDRLIFSWNDTAANRMRTLALWQAKLARGLR